MIRLDIQDYCGLCCDFEADVTKSFKQAHRVDGTDEYTFIQTDTIIRCKHSKRCDFIRRYLKQQLMNEIEEENKV